MHGRVSEWLVGYLLAGLLYIEWRSIYGNNQDRIEKICERLRCSLPSPREEGVAQRHECMKKMAMQCSCCIYIHSETHFFSNNNLRKEKKSHQDGENEVVG